MISQNDWQKQDIFERISKSKFRSRFKLTKKDIAYVNDKGMDTIRSHAYDFIEKRLAPAFPSNDGKQTPMKGHPIFLAQHACACCCRGCLEKWHGIKAGEELTKEEQDFVVNMLMEWVKRQMEND